MSGKKSGKNFTAGKIFTIKGGEKYQLYKSLADNGCVGC